MKISKQARREAKGLLRICFVNGLLDEGRAREAVKRIIQARPRGYLAILSHFQRLVKLDLDQRTARVESAAALGTDMRTQLQAALGRTYGPGINISFAENPRLIGGVRVKVGSDVYDGSIRARLSALQECF